MIELAHGVIVAHANRIGDAPYQAADRVGPMHGDEPVDLLLHGQANMHGRRFNQAAADFHIVILQCVIPPDACLRGGA